MTKAPSILELHAKQSAYQAGYGAALAQLGPPKTEAALKTVAASSFNSDILQRCASPSEAEGLLKFIDQHPEFKALKTSEERKRYLAKRMREIRAEEAGLASKRDRLAYLYRATDAVKEMFEWTGSPLVLQKPDGSSFRAMRKAIANGEGVYFNTSEEPLPANDYEKEVFTAAEILVVEHDWAAAFDSTELPDGDVKLPYDTCAFEFKISDRMVIVLATHLDAAIYFAPIVWTSFGWVVPDFSLPITSDVGGSDESPKFDKYINVLGLVIRQIKAICVALDAEIAKTDVVREPHAGNIGNNFHAAFKTYHVVSLARRHAHRLTADSTGTGRRKRLHFRRGHWRHFPTFKTWIKWTLVGDPELGFIDKHYRL